MTNPSSGLIRPMKQAIAKLLPAPSQRYTTRYGFSPAAGELRWTEYGHWISWSAPGWRSPNLSGPKPAAIAAEIADARAALERCHAEVKRFVAAKKAMAKMLAARPASQGLVSASPRRDPVDAPQHGDDEEGEREPKAYAWTAGAGGAASVQNSPLPGKPTVTRLPRGPTVYQAPRVPTLSDAPERLRFTRRPGRSETPRVKRRGISRHPTASGPQARETLCSDKEWRAIWTMTAPSVLRT